MSTNEEIDEELTKYERLKCRSERNLILIPMIATAYTMLSVILILTILGVA